MRLNGQSDSTIKTLALELGYVLRELWQCILKNICWYEFCVDRRYSYSCHGSQHAPRPCRWRRLHDLGVYCVNSNWMDLFAGVRLWLEYSQYGSALAS